MLSHCCAYCSVHSPSLPSFPTRRSSDLGLRALAEHLRQRQEQRDHRDQQRDLLVEALDQRLAASAMPVLLMLDLVLDFVRSEEHTSELQSHSDLVCRLLLEKKNMNTKAL